MATPEFILDLRAKVGHAPLWLTGVTAVVLRQSQVLLVRRADTGEWSPITGIIDPGEEPADAAAREVYEEANVRAVPEQLTLVHTIAPVVYANGDEAQYLDLVFRFRWVSGTAFPADGENLSARWFDLDELPEMSADYSARVESALDFDDVTNFKFNSRTHAV